MLPRFDEPKTTQMAALLLKLRGTRRMHYLKLMKLMYLIDRESLLRWGWSMTGDKYVSMEHGLVLSNTLNLITQERFGRSYWKEFISAPLGDYEVQAVKDPNDDELSQAEIELINEVYGKFGHWNRWRLRDYTHDLPEYIETESSIPVAYASVMKGEKVPEEQVEEVLTELHGMGALEQLTR
jgi:hypothetical protein